KQAVVHVGLGQLAAPAQFFQGLTEAALNAFEHDSSRQSAPDRRRPHASPPGGRESSIIGNPDPARNGAKPQFVHGHPGRTPVGISPGAASFGTFSRPLRSFPSFLFGFSPARCLAGRGDEVIISLAECPTSHPPLQGGSTMSKTLSLLD